MNDMVLRTPWICRNPLARLLGWLIIPLILFLPFAGIDFGSYSGNSDIVFYTNIYSFVSNSLHAGIVWPRWFAAANSDYGNPVMLFYSPAAYILTAIINIPFASFISDIRIQILIGIYASQVLSGYTAYLWLKNRFSTVTAYSGSQLYVLLPFKIIYICLNGNLTQVWALAFLPLWMLAAQRMLASHAKAIGLYALAAAATFYMHPITIISFGAVPALYVMWFGRDNLLANIGKLSLAHLLAMGLCLMQAYPQHMYLPWVHPEGFLNGIYVWNKNFFHIDVMFCAYYGIVAILVLYGMEKIPHIRNSQIGREAWFWAIILTFVAFMTQRISNFVWELIPILQYLQFPAVRLHAVALMAVVFLFCIWLEYYEAMLPRGKRAYHRLSIALLIAISATFIFMHIYDIYLPGDSWDVPVARATHLIIPAEYQTKWGCKDRFKTLAEYKEHRIDSTKIKTEKGEAETKVIRWQPPADITLQTDIHSDNATFALHQCYFPLWKAYDANKNDILLFPSKIDGVIQFTLPHGKHQLTITFTTPWLEYRGRLISALSLLICAALLWPKNLEHHYPLRPRRSS